MFTDPAAVTGFATGLAVDQTDAATTPTDNTAFEAAKADLGDSDRHLKNAKALRLRLGRACPGAMQKQLETHRRDFVPAPMCGIVTPAVPTDAMSGTCAAVWPAAQALTLGRSEAVTHERDTHEGRVPMPMSDLVAGAATLDKPASELGSCAPLFKDMSVTVGVEREAE